MIIFNVSPQHYNKNNYTTCHSPGGLLFNGGTLFDLMKIMLWNIGQIWKLIHRTENEMIELLPYVDHKRYRLKKDATVINVFTCKIIISKL